MRRQTRRKLGFDLSGSYNRLNGLCVVQEVVVEGMIYFVSGGYFLAVDRLIVLEWLVLLLKKESFLVRIAIVFPECHQRMYLHRI